MMNGTIVFRIRHSVNPQYSPYISMDRAPVVPLHITALAILSPNNSPLFVHSFTGKADELRHYHLAHAAIDVIEERSEQRTARAR